MTRGFLILMLIVLIGGYGTAPETESSDTQSPEQASREVNAEALQKVITRINRYGDINDPATPRPLLTLEEFFEGNTDYASIGYNFYSDQPAPSEFYALFKTIRDMREVADIRVEVKDHEDAEGWPATDTVWVITSASVEDLKSWLG